MPLFEITDDGLSPFNRLQPGPDLYEEEIEALARADLDRPHLEHAASE